MGISRCVWINFTTSMQQKGLPMSKRKASPWNWSMSNRYEQSKVYTETLIDAFPYSIELWIELLLNPQLLPNISEVNLFSILLITMNHCSIDSRSSEKSDWNLLWICLFFGIDLLSRERIFTLSVLCLVLCDKNSRLSQSRPHSSENFSWKILFWSLSFDRL